MSTSHISRAHAGRYAVLPTCALLSAFCMHRMLKEHRTANDFVVHSRTYTLVFYICNIFSKNITVTSQGHNKKLLLLLCNT